MGKPRVFDLGDLSRANDEEVVNAIERIIRENGSEPSSFLYRGLVCFPEKLELILSSGTDRSISGWKSAAERWRSFNERSEPGITMRQALEDTNPDYVWATKYRDILSSVDCADHAKNGEFSVILGYNSSSFEQCEGEDQLYKFLVPPTEALRFVFKYL